MNSRRRHANDFTDSLNSFRQTSEESIQYPEVSSGGRDEFLYSVRNEQGGDDKYGRMKNDESCVSSIILAGSLNQPCTSSSDSCNAAEKNYYMYKIRQLLLKNTLSPRSDETSYMSLKPDLNKRINLFHNEYLNNEYNSREEQLNTTLSEITVGEDINSSHLNKTVRPWYLHRPRSLSANSLRNKILVNQGLRRSKSYTVLDRASKRDTNYNVKDDQLSFPARIAMEMSRNETVEAEIVPSFDTLSLSKPPDLSNRKDDSMRGDQCDSVTSEMSSRDEINPSELRRILHLLADQKPSIQEAPMPQRLLRRMSVNYYDAPKNFTEGLLTIIEESVMTNDFCAPTKYPEVSLCRFNEELRKMCKFIEDETVPEWPQSPSVLTSTRRQSQEPNSNLLRRSLDAFVTPDKGLYLTTSASPRRNNKTPKKMFRRMSKNASYIAKDLHDSTNTFENLEAMCKQLYPDDYRSFSARERSQLDSPLRNMDKIWRTCESQMASLEDSPNIHEQLKKLEPCTANSAYQHDKTPEAQHPQYRLLSNEKNNETNSKRVSDMRKQRTERGKRETMELDDLENTLLYEIAKKRQRCLDTAQVIMEINGDLNSTEAQETYPNIVVSQSSPTKNDVEFMKTLMCVKKYQDYLEKSKPLINLLYQARLSNPRASRDGRAARAKGMSNENLDACAPSVLSGNRPTLRAPRLSPRKKSTSPSSAKKLSTNKTAGSKLFVTPGKSVNKSCKPKRTYFPNMLPGTKKQDKPNVSPHAKRIYGQIGNYDHITSPVGKYIKGEETHLIKRPKTIGTLLTPKRKQTTHSPSPRMKFRLSPKEKPTGTTVADENVADNFSQPKVHCNIPSHVCTVNETKDPTVGNHVNVLLRSTQGCKSDHLK
ncbi:PREDICTED: uncharacterized protein LOC105455136 isoform X2 [Wasmannia auropunctata]|uniref:uncharacterized protein LOC105455136 isoform X2 n=1 Tax=Wasmannia auropunctata TaxID=64793 RepID=UPI0005EFF4F1|nr:PREDICTED: uncharacterized protein LOC105455136 isoform X2 [Wasmannia auropunctata]